MTTRTATAFATFVLSVIASNVLVSWLGAVDVIRGPATLFVPAGVFAVGFALVARDVVHEHGGARIAAAAVLVGALASLPFADRHVVVGSVVAYLASELVDLAVFAAVIDSVRWEAAALISSSVALVVDSVAFLLLAFGSLAFLDGQILGKLCAVLAFVAVRRVAAERA